MQTALRVQGHSRAFPRTNAQTMRASDPAGVPRMCAQGTIDRITARATAGAQVGAISAVHAHENVRFGLVARPFHALQNAE